MSTSNQQTYESFGVVLSYRLRTGLQPAEERILRLLVEQGLGRMKLLDIGVGGGRTTVHFAPAAGEYTGIDYSANMIRACRRRFPERAGAFHLCDVRRMDRFAEQTFDAVLFSYNGIDYIPHEDRLAALREIRRVLRTGGWFCFSSHNILALGAGLIPDALTWNPLALLHQALHGLMLRRLNSRPVLEAAREHPYQIIREPHQVSVYYGRPSYQLDQLREHGFRDVRVFGCTDGREIEATDGIDRHRDPWLYFLCRS